MIEHRKTFLNEMKALLSYFVEFSKNKSILPKNYLEYYIVSGSNKKPIIIIIHDKSIFLTNNR